MFAVLSHLACHFAFGIRFMAFPMVYDDVPMLLDRNTPHPSDEGYASNQMIEIMLCGMLPGDDSAGIANHHGMGRHIAIDIGIGGDQNILSHRNIANDRCIDSNPYAVADRRRSFARSTIFLPDGHALVNVDIITEDRFFVDRDVIRMAQVQSLSNDRIPRNFNTVFLTNPFKSVAVVQPQELIFACGCFPEVIAEFPAVAFCTFRTVSVHITFKEFLKAVHMYSTFHCGLNIYIIAYSGCNWK